MFYPMVSYVHINKDDIVSNRPFAGRMEVKDNITGDTSTLFIGTYISCQYWTNRDKLPTEATWKITYSLFTKMIGSAFRVEMYDSPYQDDIYYYELPEPDGYLWTECEDGEFRLMPDTLYSDLTKVLYIQGQDTIELHFIN